MGQESKMAYSRFGKTQSTEEPYNSLKTRLRTAHVYTYEYIENEASELTIRPLFTNSKLR
jgi:hypothetical protein